MNLLDLAKKRFSVRSYDFKKVEQEKLLQILEAGRIAPTAGNRQPHRLIVVQTEEGLKKLAAAANIYGAPLAIIVCGDSNSAWVRKIDGKNVVDIDASIVTDHMMLAATELGLGTVWVCNFNPAIVCKEFNIPDTLEPINILVVGYGTGKLESPERHATTRKSMNEIVFYESYK